MNSSIGWGTVGMGFFIMILGTLLLLVIIPRRSEKWERGIAIFALKTASTLVIGGLGIMFLGFLYLMEMVPWWM